MTLDYYGGLLVVMFPGQFQKNENGNWTASFKMPAQDITTRVYVSSKLKVTLTGENKTVEYNGQPQTIDSAIKAKLGDVEASEAMWGHYDVTYPLLRTQALIPAPSRFRTAIRCITAMKSLSR